MLYQSNLPAKQTGALGLFAILTLLLAILFAALAVDTGRLLMEQRRLQTVADMAALDASSATGSCGSGTFDDVEALAQASAGRNNHAGQPLEVLVGVVDVGAGGVREFTETTADIASAVSVSASETVPASLFAGGILGNNTTLQANAVAERAALAGFSAGSLLLSISDEQTTILNNVFGSILGSPLSLDVLSYQGIANTQVSLGELAFIAGVASPEELLGSEFTLGELMQIYADAVNADEAATVEAITGSQALADLTVNTLTAEFSDILALTTEKPIDAAEAEINLFDLINTTAIVANGTNAINLPMQLNLPGGLLAVETQLTVTEAPQIAIGRPGRDGDGNWRTEIDTAQLRLVTTIEDDLPGINLGVINAEVSIDIVIELETAQGTAWLQSIQCGSIDNRNAVVTIGNNTGAATLTSSRASNPAEEPFIGIGLSAILLGSCDVKLPPINTAIQSPVSEDLIFDVPQPTIASLPMAQETGTGLGLTIDLGSGEPENNCSGLLSVVGLTIDQLISPILADIVSPLVTDLLSEIIEPILTMLGIKIGSMDVTLFSVEVERPEMQR
ncbi:MAG: pilus assembly protein TadG-related protein [Methylophaga sp.]